VSLIGVRKFKDMPLSTPTQRGLAAMKFKEMTAIQRATIPHALCGRDILGAAKTGSGKTLAFIVPMLETLYRLKWGRLDGLGGLVVAPTRELAMQIFKQCVDIGSYHSLSAGLLIGGKNVKEEKDTVNKMNVLVATPGRLLQHMDETPLFDCVTLKVLVLDEADRILDLGFAATLKAILENLPEARQTLCFSATQTKSVKDLARLSLKNPEYLAVHAESASSTPPKLAQLVATCELDKKIETLWAFMKSHLTCKTLVFLSSCKQVRFVHEIFRRMRPGAPVAMLHGRMKQQARMKTFESFARADHACLFATDVAARGLDFPSVDWVVQADCPEDVPCYIHRVGRTARYTAEGKGLLLLAPSELAFAEELAAAKVPLRTMKLNHAKNQNITASIQGLLGKDNELKYLAQRSVVSYLRSVYLQPNKNVFDVDALDVRKYANSVGLPNPPRLRFLKSAPPGKDASGKSRGDDDASDDDASDDDASDDDDAVDSDAADDSDAGETTDSDSRDDADADADADAEIRDRGIVRRAGGGHFGIQIDGADEDDELMTLKRANHRLKREGDDANDEDDEYARLSVAARAALADGPADLSSALRARAKKGKLRIKTGGHGGNDRVVFDEDGSAMAPLERLGNAHSGPVPEGGAELAAVAKARYDRVKAQRLEADVADRAREKRRLRDLRDKNKAKERKLAGDDSGGEGGDSRGGAAVLGGDDSGTGSESGSDSESGSSDSSESDQPRKRNKIDVSVSGMALKRENIESLEQRALRLLG
jgi:ATP-dependent RNA helicase DDX10/DBP4